MSAGRTRGVSGERRHRRAEKEDKARAVDSAGSMNLRGVHGRESDAVR